MDKYFKLATTIYPVNMHYHSYKHISDMLKWFELYKESFIEEGMRCSEEDMCLAIVYHDAVYIPDSKTNEYDSVQFMKRCGIINPTIEQLIMSTIVNGNIDNWKNYNIDCKILHDLDWFVFSSDINIFTTNMAIISEVECYCRNKYSRKEIVEARMEFLKSLFDKQIFYSKTLQKFNDSAKENIKKYYEGCKQFL